MSVTVAAGRFLGFLRCLPVLVAFRVAEPLIGHEKAFLGASEGIARIPGYLGVFARQVFYRRILSELGDGTFIGFNTLLSKASIKVGNGVYIGRNCIIGLADIGDNALIADGVQLLSGRHQHGASAGEETERYAETRFTRISIGERAWVGAGAVVMADVGADAIVGAGSVVVSAVAAGDVVAGVPARPTKQRAPG